MPHSAGGQKSARSNLGRQASSSLTSPRAGAEPALRSYNLRVRLGSPPAKKKIKKKLPQPADLLRILSGALLHPTMLHVPIGYGQVGLNLAEAVVPWATHPPLLRRAAELACWQRHGSVLQRTLG